MDTETFSVKVRQIWIDAVLDEDGEIRRQSICDHFGISMPQASLDLRRYMSVNSHRIFYDKSAKLYRTVEGSKPQFSRAAHSAAFEIVHHVGLLSHERDTAPLPQGRGND